MPWTSLGCAPACVGSIDATRQTYQSWRQKHLDGSVHDHAGMWLPNKFGMCKHTVKKNDVLQANGELRGEHLGGHACSRRERCRQMAMAGDKEMGRIFGDVMQMMSDPEGKIPDEQLIQEDWNPHGEKGSDTCKAAWVLSAQHGTMIQSALLRRSHQGKRGDSRDVLRPRQQAPPRYQRGPHEGIRCARTEGHGGACRGSQGRAGCLIS